MGLKGLVVNKRFFGSIIMLIFIIIFESCTNSNYLHNNFLEGPTSNVNIENWRKIKIGMTKEQVIILIGNSPSQHSIPNNNDSCASSVFWEYGYQSLLGPHEKAYVVFFNSDGLVSALQEPNDGK